MADSNLSVPGANTVQSLAPKNHAITLLLILSLSVLTPHLFQDWLVFAGETRSGNESDWQKTIEAAKKEGKIAVFLYQRDNIEAAVKRRRAAGMNYIVMDTPERSDQEPVNKLLKEIIKK